MRVVKKDLGGEKRDIKIKVLADVHIGSPKCHLQEFRKEVEQIAQDPDCYVILAGDLINNGTKNSVTGPYDEEMPPMEQLKLAINILEPIKDKIICICTGNHEERTFRESGQDLTWVIAKQFGLEDAYDSVGVVAVLRYGKFSSSGYGGNGHDRKTCVSIYVSHGSGGGRTIGAKANALQRRGDIVNADIIVQGHTHTPMTYKEDYFFLDTNNAVLKRKERIFINTGAWLDYEPYAEKIGLRPSNCSIPTIYLNGSGKKSISVII